VIPRFPGEPPRDLSKPLEHVKLLVREEHDGLRLDQAIKAFLTWRSRASIHRLIKGGYVDLRGALAKRAAARVRASDVVLVRIPGRPAPEDIAPDACEVPILHEDRWLVAIDKPAGLAVHPAGRRVHGTLIQFLHQRYRRPEDPAHDVVPRLLHRIDRETSGVVAVGLDEEFHGRVRRQFEERTVEKTYEAVVHGRPAVDRGTIDYGIGPDRRSRIRLKLEARRDGTGQPALTRYRVLSSNGRFSLVELLPKTGRTHQLRIHMAAIGHPLVGDKIYGVDERVFLEHLDGELSAESRRQLIIDRHALHASRLVFDHPHAGARFALEAPLPDDLASLVD
jgi:23S rRNA pseudouridine1911/1915/1917 synthase